MQSKSRSDLVAGAFDRLSYDQHIGRHDLTQFFSSLRPLKGLTTFRCHFAIMNYCSALWASLLCSALRIDMVLTEPQLFEGTDLSFLGSDALEDWYPDSDNPVGSYLDDFTIPNSFEPASLLPTTSWVDSVDTLFPEDDLFASEIAAVDCPSAGIAPKNKFRPRQACMQPLQDLPELTIPLEDDGSKDENLPENLGLFEPYDPFAYGEKDENSCPPTIFGDKKYAVCDSGNRDMFSIDQSGYANLQYCKPGT